MPIIKQTNRQSIQTKYQGPTIYKPAKIIAWAKAGKLYHDWNDGLNDQQNHETAALKLLIKLGWDNPGPTETLTLVGGTLPNGDMAWMLSYDHRELPLGNAQPQQSFPSLQSPHGLTNSHPPIPQVSTNP